MEPYTDRKYASLLSAGQVGDMNSPLCIVLPAAGSPDHRAREDFVQMALAPRHARLDGNDGHARPFCRTDIVAVGRVHKELPVASGDVAPDQRPLLLTDQCSQRRLIGARGEPGTLANEESVAFARDRTRRTGGDTRRIPRASCCRRCADWSDV